MSATQCFQFQPARLKLPGNHRLLDAKKPLTRAVRSQQKACCIISLKGNPIIWRGRIPVLTSLRRKLSLHTRKSWQEVAPPVGRGLFATLILRRANNDLNRWCNPASTTGERERSKHGLFCEISKFRHNGSLNRTTSDTMLSALFLWCMYRSSTMVALQECFLRYGTGQ